MMATQDFTSFYSRLRLAGILHLETSLRVGVGSGDDREAQADISVVKDASGAPYIPGSSFKGVLRSHVESLLRALNDDEQQSACLCVTQFPEKDDGCPTTRDPKLLREQLEDTEQIPDRETFFLTESCRACQVFGSPWLASKVMVRDLTLVEEWLGRYQYRDGVAIDRDTETASGGKLYSFEAVPAGIEFACEIILENATEEEQGMVLLGLKAFEHRKVFLGGARSRGLGRISLTWNWDDCYEVDATDKSALLDYLFTGQGRKLGEAGEAVVKGKVDAFRRSMGV